MTPLVIAFTPNYIVPAAVTLESICRSSSDEARYEIICLVSEDIPQRQKDILDRLVGNKMTFKYVNLAGSMEGAYVDPRYSEAASYRLLLPEILAEYDKVAYIDCDVIVRNDIDALFSRTDLGDNMLGVVYEAPIENQAERWEAIGCDSGHYFNSGFLLMNLKQMREEGTSKELMRELSVDYLEFPDQDVLNKVCKGRVLPLSPIYDSIRTFFLPQYKADFLKQYSEEDWKAVQEHGTIHYTGGKPWNLFTVKFGEWWKVYRTMPDEVKAEWTPCLRMSILALLYQTQFGKLAIDCLQHFYRTIKQRIQ